jgi:hypothetical protein
VSDPTLPTWRRDQYRRTDASAFLFYVVYGEFPRSLPDFSPSEYLSVGWREGLELASCSPAESETLLASFHRGFVWEWMPRFDPELAERMRSAPDCLILQGKWPDPPDLNYLRDVVGLVTFLLDCGGIGVIDPQIDAWWDPQPWRQRIFEPGVAALTKHAGPMLTSDEEGDPLWIRSVGLRKFARPDISMRWVKAQQHDLALALCDRLIEMFIQGGVLASGRVLLKEPRVSFVCRLEGDAEDPDFNNARLEIVLDQ